MSSLLKFLLFSSSILFPLISFFFFLVSPPLFFTLLFFPPLAFSPRSCQYLYQASGRISRKLAELEEYTCDILANLSTSLFRDVALDKMMSAIKALPTAELRTSPLSNVGAAYACVVLQNTPSAASELRSFFASAASHHASQTGLLATYWIAILFSTIHLHHSIFRL